MISLLRMPPKASKPRGSKRSRDGPPAAPGRSASSGSEEEAAAASGPIPLPEVMIRVAVLAARLPGSRGRPPATGAPIDDALLIASHASEWAPLVCEMVPIWGNETHTLFVSSPLLSTALSGGYKYLRPRPRADGLMDKIKSALKASGEIWESGKPGENRQLHLTGEETFVFDASLAWEGAGSPSWFSVPLTYVHMRAWMHAAAALSRAEGTSIALPPALRWFSSQLCAPSSDAPLKLLEDCFTENVTDYTPHVWCVRARAFVSVCARGHARACVCVWLWLCVCVLDHNAFSLFLFSSFSSPLFLFSSPLLPTAPPVQARLWRAECAEPSAYGAVPCVRCRSPLPVQARGRVPAVQPHRGNRTGAAHVH